MLATLRRSASYGGQAGDLLMLATVYSGAVQGVDAYAVEIEVNAGHGDPQVVTVGLPKFNKFNRDRPVI